jgi:hypothetical protein
LYGDKFFVIFDKANSPLLLITNVFEDEEISPTLIGIVFYKKSKPGAVKGFRYSYPVDDIKFLISSSKGCEKKNIASCYFMGLALKKAGASKENYISY